MTFERSIRVTIEHGHANKRSDDYSSVAYWYQAEPHKPFSIPAVGQRAGTDRSWTGRYSGPTLAG